MTRPRSPTRAALPFPLTFDTLLASLYGPHPYGRPALGQRQTVERLDPGRLGGQYRRPYPAGRSGGGGGSGASSPPSGGGPRGGGPPPRRTPPQRAPVRSWSAPPLRPRS